MSLNSSDSDRLKGLILDIVETAGGKILQQGVHYNRKLEGFTLPQTVEACEALEREQKLFSKGKKYSNTP